MREITKYIFEFWGVFICKILILGKGDGR